MNPIWGHVIGVVTVVLMVTFIGIWIWAWRKRHRATFQRMSEIPLEDSPIAQPDDAKESTKEPQR